MITCLSAPPEANLKRVKPLGFRVHDFGFTVVDGDNMYAYLGIFVYTYTYIYTYLQTYSVWS